MKRFLLLIILCLPALLFAQTKKKKQVKPVPEEKPAPKPPAPPDTVYDAFGGRYFRTLIAVPRYAYGYSYPTNWNYMVCSSDSVHRIHGRCLIYDQTGSMHDSGTYVHGYRTGEWISWYPGGKVKMRAYFTNQDSLPERYVAYYTNGFTSDSAWRIHASPGDYWFVKKYSSIGLLTEKETSYPLKGKAYIHARYISHHQFSEAALSPELISRHVMYSYNQKSPRNPDEYKGGSYIEFPTDFELRDSVVVRQYADRSHLDSTFSVQGWLRSVSSGNRKTSFFPNGQKSSFMNADTSITWFDNGVMASQSIDLRKRTFVFQSGPGELAPQDLSRTYDTQGQMLSEYYQYPEAFHVNGGILRLTDERGRVIAEGHTDDHGLRHGYWHHYRWTAAGEFYCSEEGNYDHGCRSGKWKGWQANGQRGFEAEYKVMKRKYFLRTLYASRVPRGECDKFVIDKVKKKHSEIRYSQLVNRYTEYTREGKIRADIHLTAEGVYDGEWILCDTAGKLISKRYYRNGMPRDSAFWNDKNGALVQTDYYDSTGYWKKSIRPKPDLRAQLPGWDKILLQVSLTDSSPNDPMERWIANKDGLGPAVTPGVNYKAYKNYTHRYERKFWEKLLLRGILW